MRGTRTDLLSNLLVLVFIATPPVANAADECLTKPNEPTPQGQHWYYWIDHANGGQQCWYLRAENARNQKVTRQVKANSPEADTRTMDSFAQQLTPAETPASASDRNMPVAVAPIPWLSIQRWLETASFFQHTVETAQRPHSASPTAEAKSTGNAPDEVADPAVNSPLPNARPQQQHRTSESHRGQSPQPLPRKPSSVTADIDHTFSLPTILFGALAIAGLAVHFVERRRRRKAISFQPPRWARVVAVNRPTPRIRVSRASSVSPLAPLTMKSSDQTERLARALQQLIDRLQEAEGPRPKSVRTWPANRASI